MRHQHVLFWGGLRGALALALALGLPAGLPQRDDIVTVAFAVVAFSVFAQGLTMGPLLRRLGELNGGRPAIYSDEFIGVSTCSKHRSPLLKRVMNRALAARCRYATLGCIVGASDVRNNDTQVKWSDLSMRTWLRDCQATAQTCLGQERRERRSPAAGRRN